MEPDIVPIPQRRQFTAAAFAGRPAFGSVQDAGAVATGLSEHVGHAAGAFFAVALIDASVFGAMAVTLSTAYAIGGMLFTAVISAALLLIRREDRRVWIDSYGRTVWRMPPLDQLPRHN